MKPSESAPPPHILIVEDEPKIAALVRDYLNAVGYRTTVFGTGAGVVEWIQAETPDLVLLDLMLPGVDGLTVCRNLRAGPAPGSRVPVIMMTARVEEIDRLLGLEVGADDYVCKPFSYAELVARVKALLRRVALETAQAAGVASQGIFALDESRLEARFGSRVLPLTPVEFRLLSALLAEPGRVCSREALMTALYRDHRVVSDRTVDSHVKNLRRKLVEAGGHEAMLHSIYGVGYKLDPDAPPEA